MRSFILRTALFVLPFMLLYVVNVTAYRQDEGDLVRLGYLYGDRSPKSAIAAPFTLSTAYTLLSAVDTSTSAAFDVMTIGDSFSGQDSLGYKNFMAHQGVSVLHVDRSLAGPDPVQRLVELLNSGFFDRIQVGAVVLQTAERLFVQRCEHIDFAKTVALDSLFDAMPGPDMEKTGTRIRFFSNAMLKIPWTNWEYRHTDKPADSQTYRVATTSNELFTNGPKELLFFEDDLKAVPLKNDTAKIAACNRNLEEIARLLAKRSIKLIVLVSPDKYDLYYPYIVDKATYKEPKFFPYYNKLPKSYANLDAFGPLSAQLPVVKDVYYYDDTHWSPATAKWVGEQLAAMVKGRAVR